MKTAILLTILLGVALAARQINYPVRLTYVDIISDWSSPEAIAAGMGVPGYAPDHMYNYIVLAFWRYNQLWDFAKVWNDPQAYFFSKFGTTKKETQTKLLQLYHNKGISLLVSAFGADDYPTNIDANTLATKLAQYVKDNMLDGVDLDYEDNGAMMNGNGRTWVVAVTKKLR